VAKAFAGAVPRAIQADLPSGFELWYPQWKIGGPSEKPWTVEYRSLMFPNSHRRLPIDLMLIKSELRFAIQRAIRFAWKSGTDLEKWGDWLEHALPLLDDANPVAPFHPDMLPEEGYSLLARQILAAAAQADVFHGMGSWNDVSFQDTHFQREYRSVSEQLYEAFKLATVMVPNSFENGTQGI
jgi:hypothetical protein